MTTGRESTLLWSIAGALLLAAGVVVVVAMTPSDEVPLPAPAPPPAESATTRLAEAPPSSPAAPLAPSTLIRADVPVVVRAAPPPAVEVDSAEGVPEADADPSGEVVPEAAPRGAVPPAASALQGVRLAVPIAQALDPTARPVRPPIADQRLDAMENMVAGQEAQIRRLEASLAEAERIGDIEGARLRRGRIATLRRIHGTLDTQLERMRTEHAAAAQN